MGNSLTMFPLPEVSRDSGISVILYKLLYCKLSRHNKSTSLESTATHAGVVRNYIGRLFSLVLLLLITTSAYPQNNSTPVSAIDSTEISHSTERSLPIPARASMLSATLPGFGQIYNRKYWKVPIIYAGFGAVAYFVNHNNNEYQKFRSAYIARIDGNPNTVDDFPLYSTNVLERAMNLYRRNLEVTYLLAAALYLLNILDANVDAHLMDFDVGETLSMGMSTSPAAVYSGHRMPAASPGFTIRINF